LRTPCGCSSGATACRADGVLGPATLRALNVTAQRRAEQLRVNLERWRWLPRAFPDRHIEVNIPAYTLRLIEGGRITLRMNAIVGRSYRQTPVFSARMTYLGLNPYWEVPAKLARLDVLPRVRADARYLQDMGFEVLQGWGTEERRLDPADIDWQSLDGGALPFRLRQAPGPRNALGRIKFMFPNPYNVYIHDTPHRELFGMSRRDFSSGCIRISRPIDLASRLLEGTGDWMEARLEQATETGEPTVTVPLARPVEVHVLYFTAWAGEDGALQLRDDIYRRDGDVLRGLDAPPPGS